MCPTTTTNMGRKDGLKGKTWNIAVVGLSGPECVKGSEGVGKSGLCNRFVRPSANDFFPDHPSVLSSTDFGGRVINNDHFLYWGERMEPLVSGDTVFRIIEQTEFINDITFQPFKTTKVDMRYVKRCVATKISSDDKLQYICKDQIGVEDSYEKHVFPSATVNIDGFICCFDVSVVDTRPADNQSKYLTEILTQLVKTRRPIVLATTKNDVQKMRLVREIERLVDRKEFRGKVRLIETSAHRNVNVTEAFTALGHVLNKTKIQTYVPNYEEALRGRERLLAAIKERYEGLINTQVNDYLTLWRTAQIEFAHHGDFKDFVHNYGTDAARKLFWRRLKTLRDDHIRDRKSTFLARLEAVIETYMPQITTLPAALDMPHFQEFVENQSDFDVHFVVIPGDVPWDESVYLHGNDTRIPFDFLTSHEGEGLFASMLNSHFLTTQPGVIPANGLHAPADPLPSPKSSNSPLNARNAQLPPPLVPQSSNQASSLHSNQSPNGRQSCSPVGNVGRCDRCHGNVDHFRSPPTSLATPTSVSSPRKSSADANDTSSPHCFCDSRAGVPPVPASAAPAGLEALLRRTSGGSFGGSGSGEQGSDSQRASLCSAGSGSAMDQSGPLIRTHRTLEDLGGLFQSDTTPLLSTNDDYSPLNTVNKNHNNNNNNNNNNNSSARVGGPSRPPSMGLRATALKTGVTPEVGVAPTTKATFVTKLELEVAHERTRSDPTSDLLWSLPPNGTDLSKPSYPANLLQHLCNNDDGKKGNDNYSRHNVSVTRQHSGKKVGPPVPKRTFRERCNSNLAKSLENLCQTPITPSSPPSSPGLLDDLSDPALSPCTSLGGGPDSTMTSVGGDHYLHSSSSYTPPEEAGSPTTSPGSHPHPKNVRAHEHHKTPDSTASSSAHHLPFHPAFPQRFHSGQSSNLVKVATVTPLQQQPQFQQQQQLHQNKPEKMHQANNSLCSSSSHGSSESGGGSGGGSGSVGGSSGSASHVVLPPKYDEILKTEDGYLAPKQNHPQEEQRSPKHLQSPSHLHQPSQSGTTPSWAHSEPLHVQTSSASGVAKGWVNASPDLQGSGDGGKGGSGWHQHLSPTRQMPPASQSEGKVRMRSTQKNQMKNLSQHLSPHRLSANEVLLNAYLAPAHCDHRAAPTPFANPRNSGDEHFLLGLPGGLAPSPLGRQPDVPTGCAHMGRQPDVPTGCTHMGRQSDVPGSDASPAFHHIMHEEPEQLIHQSVEPFMDHENVRFSRFHQQQQQHQRHFSPPGRLQSVPQSSASSGSRTSPNPIQLRPLPPPPQVESMNQQHHPPPIPPRTFETRTRTSISPSGMKTDPPPPTYDTPAATSRSTTEAHAVFI